MTVVNLTQPKIKHLDPWMDNLFNSIFSDPLIQNRAINQIPAVNISETDVSYEIDLAAPGLKKEDFKINLEKNELSVKVEKKETSKVEGKKLNKQEFNYQSFTRKFMLPEIVDATKINASYNDGLLHLELMKKEKEKNLLKEIEVK